MKIWYQTSSPYRYSPMFEEYGKSLGEQCRRAARPGTEIYVTGVPVFMLEEDRYKIIRYYHVSQVLSNVRQAQREGYDAFIIGNTLEFGLEEGRGLVSIPVLGISQTSYFLAAMLGELFAIVTTAEHLNEQYRQQVERYGLRDKHLRGNYVFPISEEELALNMLTPMPIVEKFAATARRAIADGASVIIPAPGLLPPILNRGGLTNIDGVPILDSLSIAVKFAEMLVDLRPFGVDFSRKLGVYANPSKQLSDEMFRKYSEVFRISNA